jgi:lipopolysaccharide/colanic/teichoic acid biosynthesis glycosyltransferase
MPSSLYKTSSFLFYPYLIVGVLLIAFIPPIFALGLNYWSVTFWQDTTSNSMVTDALAFFISAFAFRRFERFPQKNSLAFILPIGLSVFGMLVTLLLALRVSYSIKIIGLGLLMTVIMLGIQHALSSRSRHLRLAVVPLGEALSFVNADHYTFLKLVSPAPLDSSIDGLLADMHSDSLTPNWERFLSDCALKRIPVYNAMQFRESMTGKVNVKHLVANNFGDLSPSIFHQNLKRVLDVLFLVLLSPIILPVMLVIAIWISMDSEGGAFFIQPRMGFHGKWFNVIKFRSMVVNHQGSCFTEEGEDHRITNVGKIIRKYRLDELPQFWNVLKGEMSLIGPRPESAELARWYDEEVPFFAYRHVVRPGISGWAQVMHGYAAGVDDMKDKLAYDFYYIKHFSLWLDLLIWYKTIRTVFTGFGSR